MTDRAEIVRASWDRLATVRGDVAQSILRHLAARSPASAALFDELDADAQRDTLILMMSELVRALDHPDIVDQDFQQSGRRHVVYGVRDADYTHLGSALLSALAEHLRDDFTPAVRDAWSATYEHAANAMRHASEQYKGRR